MFNCRHAKQNKNLSLYCLLIGQKLITDTHIHTHSLNTYLLAGVTLSVLTLDELQVFSFSPAWSDTNINQKN